MKDHFNHISEFDITTGKLTLLPFELWLFMSWVGKKAIRFQTEFQHPDFVPKVLGWHASLRRKEGASGIWEKHDILDLREMTQIGIQFALCYPEPSGK